MELIDVNDIVISTDRIRKVFEEEELLKLRNSIVASGLFHPLLLRQDTRTLVAGERRLRCLKSLREEGIPVIFDGELLPLGKAPCVIMGSIDEAAYLEAEFTENTRRVQLSWQEECLYISRYKAYFPDKNIKEVGKDLHISDHIVSKALLLTPFLEDPEIADSDNRDLALKALEKKTEKRYRKTLVERLGNVTRTALHELIHGDMRVVLPGLEANRFDCIIADPPYGVNAHKWDNMSAEEHPYDDTPEYAAQIYDLIAREGFRVTKAEAHAYIFCEYRRHHEVSDLLSAWGWRVFPWPLIYWRGPTNGIVPWPDSGPRRTFECIAFAIKGNRRTLGVFPDVLSHPDSGSGEDRGGHKPPSLYEDLISRCCMAGEEVLDPCVGTGPIFDAATSLRVRAFGIEIETSAYARARERLA